MGEYDGTDHRDQQHQPRSLEDEQVAGVEDGAERLDVGHRDVGGGRPRSRFHTADAPGKHREDDLGQKHQGKQAAERQIARESSAHRREIDVQHHHHEQEQHRDSANVDDDQQ